MFMPVVNGFRWLWSDVLLPYVVLALAALVSDGLEAWASIGETVYVICCFLGGCSHRAYPLPEKELDAKKKVALDLLRAEEKKLRSAAAAADDSADDAASEGNRSPPPSQPPNGEAPAAPAGEGAGAAATAPLYIQRRVLLGKKGERELWLDAVVGRLLVPLSFPQSYSHSLHRLVRSVIGPIQQPTVTTMPARHMAPQWPPHFVRSNRSGTAAGGVGAAGGRAGVGGAASPIASTDDYSSSNSVGLRRRLEGGAGSSSSAGEGTATARGLAGARRGGHGEYYQNAKVVYKRLSKRQMEFQPTRKHMFDAQAIASITAHHVLSYRATRQKVLAIDLDETLCHVSTSTANMLGPPTFSEVIPTTTGAELFHVWERPHVRLFLETMSKLFNLVLFTSASKPYADTILRRIDPNYLLKERYYRQDCRVVSRGSLAKTLREKRLAAAAGVRGASAEAAAAAAGTSAAASATEEDSASGSARTPTSATTESAATAAPLPAGVTSAIAREGERPPLNENAKVLIKDLRVLKVPSELLIMIDNSEECMLLSRENALIIAPFIPSFDSQRKAAATRKVGGGSNTGTGAGGGGSPLAAAVGEEDGAGFGDPEEDEVLLALMTFLEAVLVVPDVRSILRHGKIY